MNHPLIFNYLLIFFNIFFELPPIFFNTFVKNSKNGNKKTSGVSRCIEQKAKSN